MVDRASAVGSGSAHGAAAAPPGADKKKAAEFRTAVQGRQDLTGIGQPIIWADDNRKYTEAEIQELWGAKPSVAKRLAEETHGVQVIHVVETAAHHLSGAVNSADDIVRKLNRETPNGLSQFVNKAKLVKVKNYKTQEGNDRRFVYNDLKKFVDYIYVSYFSTRRKALPPPR